MSSQPEAKNKKFRTAKRRSLPDRAERHALGSSPTPFMRSPSISILLSTAAYVILFTLFSFFAYGCGDRCSDEWAAGYDAGRSAGYESGYDDAKDSLRNSVFKKYTPIAILFGVLISIPLVILFIAGYRKHEEKLRAAGRQMSEALSISGGALNNWSQTRWSESVNFSGIPIASKCFEHSHENSPINISCSQCGSLLIPLPRILLFIGLAFVSFCIVIVGLIVAKSETSNSIFILSCIIYFGFFVMKLRSYLFVLLRHLLYFLFATTSVYFIAHIDGGINTVFAVVFILFLMVAIFEATRRYVRDDAGRSEEQSFSIQYVIFVSLFVFVSFLWMCSLIGFMFHFLEISNPIYDNIRTSLNWLNGARLALSCILCVYIAIMALVTTIKKSKQQLPPKLLPLKTMTSDVLRMSAGEASFVDEIARYFLIIVGGSILILWNAVVGFLEYAARGTAILAIWTWHYFIELLKSIHRFVIDWGMSIIRTLRDFLLPFMANAAAIIFLYYGAEEIKTYIFSRSVMDLFLMLAIMTLFVPMTFLILRSESRVGSYLREDATRDVKNNVSNSNYHKITNYEMFKSVMRDGTIICFWMYVLITISTIILLVLSLLIPGMPYKLTPLTVSISNSFIVLTMVLIPVFLFRERRHGGSSK